MQMIQTVRYTTRIEEEKEKVGGGEIRGACLDGYLVTRNSVGTRFPFICYIIIIISGVFCVYFKKIFK
jgi:hypothetical protein